jgi:predicted sulfurtransferase
VSTPELPLLSLYLGVHLSPQEFHDAMMDNDTVVIDVRNFNETVLGKFAPATVLQSEGKGERVCYCRRVRVSVKGSSWLSLSECALVWCGGQGSTE